MTTEELIDAIQQVNDWDDVEALKRLVGPSDSEMVDAEASMRALQALANKMDIERAPTAMDLDAWSRRRFELLMDELHEFERVYS